MASSSQASTSRIGRGVLVRGTIRGDGDMTIEGRLEGQVEISGELEIAESARVRASVAADRVVVQGAVAGDVRGSAAIVLEDGARVVGDLEAPSVGIRPGGLLRGYVSTSGKRAPAAASRASAKGSGQQQPGSRAAVATPAPRAQRPASLQRGRDEAATTAPAVVAAPEPSQREIAPRTSVRGNALPKPPAKPPARPSGGPASQRVGFVEPTVSPMTRASGKPQPSAPPAARESAAGPPPPVVPSLKKGARGSMKKKAGR